jgi:hypothetical protein
MVRATILTTRRIDWRKVERRLTRDGYLTTQDTVSRTDQQIADQQITVTVTRPDLAALPAQVVEAARHLLGVNPKHVIACTFEAQSAWPTVVDIARAVAADAPIAVLDDHAGTTYLVHPKRGLVGPEEYQAVARRTAPSAVEVLRRYLNR